MAKRIARLPIGTRLEVSYGNGGAHHDKITGILVDSDFSDNLVILTDEGSEVLLDISIIKGVQPLQTIAELLACLEPGTKVVYSLDSATPAARAVVAENDHSESLCLSAPGGKEHLCSYSLLRCCLSGAAADWWIANGEAAPVPAVVTPMPAARVLLQDKTPAMPDSSDETLRALFESLPRQDKQLLSPMHDRFFYGVKTGDREKMRTAAHSARSVLFRKDDEEYAWSAEAARFCALLAQRMGIVDPEVALVGDCFQLAAHAARAKGDLALTGACAMMSILEEQEENKDDSLALLAFAAAGSQDVSALPAFFRTLPEGSDIPKRLLGDLCAGAGVTPAGQEALAERWKGTEMARELSFWLEEKPPAQPAAPQEKPIAPQPEKPAIKPVKPSIFGTVAQLNWASRTGYIAGDDGSRYAFRLDDVTDTMFKKKLSGCLSSDLDGAVYSVKFQTEGKFARNIQLGGMPVDRGRLIFADATRPDRYQKAMELCKSALGSRDSSRAIADLVRYAVSGFAAPGGEQRAEEALALYQEHCHAYPKNAPTLMMLAQLYGCLRRFQSMLELAERVMDTPGMTLGQMIPLLGTYLKLLRRYHSCSGDKELLRRMLQRISYVRQDYSSELETNGALRSQFIASTALAELDCCCRLGLAEEAGAVFAAMNPDGANYAAATELMRSFGLLREEAEEEAEADWDCDEEDEDIFEDDAPESEEVTAFFAA